MKIPVYNRVDDEQLEHDQNLDFSEVGVNLTLVADVMKAVFTCHTEFTGNPHPSLR